jgi:hypothetical protein
VFGVQPSFFAQEFLKATKSYSFVHQFHPSANLAHTRAPQLAWEDRPTIPSLAAQPITRRHKQPGRHIRVFGIDARLTCLAVAAPRKTTRSRGPPAGTCVTRGTFSGAVSVRPLLSERHRYRIRRQSSSAERSFRRKSSASCQPKSPLRRVTH